MRILGLVGVLAAAFACSSDRTSTCDGGTCASCPDGSGLWQFNYQCTTTGVFSVGSFVAAVTQTGCAITVTQSDDNTPTVWISTGTIDQDGKTHLTGDFGFSSAGACDGTLVAGTWTSTCTATGIDCQLDGLRP